MKRKLSLVVLAIALASCGGAKKEAAAPQTTGAAPEPAPSAAGASPMPASTRDQIKELEAQIEPARQELQLREPGESPPPGPTPFYAPAETDAKCKPAKTEKCTNSCKLSDSICKNAEKICNIAQGMQGDSWAAGRCARANLICDDAHTKCCSCR